MINTSHNKSLFSLDVARSGLLNWRRTWVLYARSRWPHQVSANPMKCPCQIASTKLPQTSSHTCPASCWSESLRSMVDVFRRRPHWSQNHIGLLSAHEGPKSTCTRRRMASRHASHGGFNLSRHEHRTWFHKQSGLLNVTCLPGKILLYFPPSHFLYIFNITDLVDRFN
jgi:hypothetical protein